MNPFAPYRWIVYLAVIAGGAAAAYAMAMRLEQVGYDRAEGVYQRAITAEVVKTAKVQAALDAARNSQEILDETHRQAIATLATRLQLRAGPARRLRDPYAAECPATAPAASTRTSADDAATAGGLLSAELTDLLQRLTSEADSINAAYASCRADAFSMRALQPH